MTTINTSPHGQIAYCANQDVFFLEFGNQCFYMKPFAFEQFKIYVENIDYEFYLNKNKNAYNKRKLMLNIGLKNVYFCLNKEEILELKDLIFNKKTKTKHHSNELLSFDIIYN